MRFSVHLPDRPPDLAILEAALQRVDVDAKVDLDTHKNKLRITTALDGAEVLRLFGAAGFPLPASELARLPSECCGSCSG